MSEPHCHILTPTNTNHHRYKLGQCIIEDPSPYDVNWGMIENCPCCEKESVPSLMRLFDDPHCVCDTFLFECPRCKTAWTER